jgi:TolA-binding protein
VSKAGAAAHPIIPKAVDEEGRPALLTKQAISPAERAFMDGWTALRKGRHQAAAESFALAAEQNKDTTNAALVEDARFWRAVALARAGQHQPAVAALREFLRHHPTSVRFGEARVILGFQLLREGQLDEAQRCFESAQQDSHSQIRDSARSGLAAVAARR